MAFTQRLTASTAAAACRHASRSSRTFHSTGAATAKILCALYPDPVTGYPPNYARDSVPEITQYPDGMKAPSLKGISFKPGELLGCVSGKLGLEKYLKDLGHELVVTSDKDGPGCEFERHLPDADVVISQPFYPAYLTRERIAMAPKLKIAITAGIGSDHVDLDAAVERKVDVVEVTFSNSISVSEHVVMMILGLVRNYIPSSQTVINGGWNIADCAARSYDVEGMHVGTVAAGRIGLAVLRRMKPFGCKLHYCDRHQLPKKVEEELGLTYHSSVEEMIKTMDVVTINCPLHSETEGLFNAAMLKKMKRGAYIVNTARAKIVDRQAILDALDSGHIAGYAGDVWFPQPAPPDHPWRRILGMTPHISGTSLSAQTRYCAGTKEILDCFFNNKPIRNEYLIVKDGKLAGAGAHAYSGGDSTKGAT